MSIEKRDKAREANRRYREKLKQAVKSKERNETNDELILNELTDIKKMLAKMNMSELSDTDSDSESDSDSDSETEPEQYKKKVKKVEVEEEPKKKDKKKKKKVKKVEVEDEDDEEENEKPKKKIIVKKSILKSTDEPAPPRTTSQGFRGEALFMEVPQFV